MWEAGRCGRIGEGHSLPWSFRHHNCCGRGCAYSHFTWHCCTWQDKRDLAAWDKQAVDSHPHKPHTPLMWHYCFQADKRDLAAWEKQATAARNKGLFFQRLHKAGSPSEEEEGEEQGRPELSEVRFRVLFLHQPLRLPYPTPPFRPSPPTQNLLSTACPPSHCFTLSGSQGSCAAGVRACKEGGQQPLAPLPVCVLASNIHGSGR